MVGNRKPRGLAGIPRFLLCWHRIGSWYLSQRLHYTPPMTETAGIIIVTLVLLPLARYYDEVEDAFGRLLDWFSKKQP